MYSNTKSPEELQDYFGLGDIPQFPARSHIVPASPIAIIRNAPHRCNLREYALVRWGLVPGWARQVKPGRPLINARAETVNEKPSFKGAMKYRRCLIPADGFYEWTGKPGSKQPWFIHRPDNTLFAFAGLWEHWLGADGSELETAVIITTTANPAIARIHHRMPAVIRRDRFSAWLDTTATSATAARQMLTPVPDDYFCFEKTAINRPANRRVAGQPRLL